MRTSSTQEQSTIARTAVIGIFGEATSAEAAIAALGRGGVPADGISLVSRGISSEGTVHGFVATRDVAAEGTRSGAWLGGLFGVLGGAALVLTPAGPVVVAGGLAAALLGGLEGAWLGAGLGAVTGAVFGHFVAARHIPMIEAHLVDGDHLVIVTTDAVPPAAVRDLLVAAGGRISDHEAP